MRTLIWIGSVLLLGGIAKAQSNDAPITVSDNNSPPIETQVRKGGVKKPQVLRPSNWLHADYMAGDLQVDETGLHVDDGYKGACITLPNNNKLPIGNNKWEIVFLNGSTKLLTVKSDDNQRIDFKPAPGKKAVLYGGGFSIQTDAYNHFTSRIGSAPASAPVLVDNTKAVLTVHYCPGGTCSAPDPCR